ncbi:MULTISPECIES: DUF2267 domain-containing protein [Rhizobium]|uniref:DUF2267 domain-containing protein n=3 Tax=Rhizobium leguminosarum TaxID=384 RepID=A0AAJ1AA63_RHILE|nr:MULTISPECIES: DUF2267 domain-containing protein [Rhizobium]MBY3153477.1 DUF2267 domain-containing protein [Rhizobium laguerreae]MBY3170172.1 DUF2267 domain-containing protein [Rhizobium laguerreae]MBY3176109.1 DUF2267 domain-containing protein [Rhizobium leguminosarum]MBY3209224.1 DUF2267 domain-containing protein [Rhizobium laguerreae]MBY5522052.1 DUF2267 domain-containing protein [Rhizobium leguminosarum]
MSDTQVAALDHTIQQTNLWLKKLVEEHHFADRHQAYNALRAVLQALRDQLTNEQAAHLSAQLPILIRGIYFEGWHLGNAKSDGRSIEAFAEHVAKHLPPQFPRDPKTTTHAVFDLLWKELDPGLTAKLIDGLPAPLRSLWPAIAGR